MPQNFLIVSGTSQKREQKAFEYFTKIKPGIRPKADPDTQIIQGKNIKLENFRSLKHFFSLKPYHKKPKVVIVLDAQNLTHNAQRILPSLVSSQKGVFILTASNQEFLSEEIRQKCQIITLPPEEKIEFEKNEKNALKKRIKTLTMSSPGEKIKFAENFNTKEEAVVFCQKMLVLTREDFLKNIKAPKRALNYLYIIKKIQRTLKMLEANANWRLAIENLFLEL